MLQQGLKTDKLLIGMAGAQSIAIPFLEQPLRQPDLSNQSDRMRALLEAGETPP